MKATKFRAQGPRTCDQTRKKSKEVVVVADAHLIKIEIKTTV